MDVNTKDYHKSESIWNAKKALKSCKSEKELIETAADIFREVGAELTKWRKENANQSAKTEVREI